MSGRRSDPELKVEFAAKLRAAIVGKVRKKEAAHALRISRQMLDLYLKAEAAPGPDVILRAMEKWSFTLRYRGQELRSSNFEGVSEVAGIEQLPVQLSLPLRDAIESLEERDLSITIKKREPDQNRIDLEVSIRFAS
jgi:hypothetical protein